MGAVKTFLCRLPGAGLVCGLKRRLKERFRKRGIEMPAVNATTTHTLSSVKMPSLGRPKPCAPPRMSSDTPRMTRPIEMARSPSRDAIRLAA